MNIEKSINAGPMSFTEAGRVILLICSILCLIVFSACSSPQTDDAHSPRLLESASRGGCSGGEDDQYIQADLTFDKAISVRKDAAEELRITIGGERVGEEDIELEVIEKKTLRIVFPVDKVTSGVLKITPSGGKEIRGITDETGQYAVRSFEVDQLVPSGVTLSVLNSEEGAVSARVASTADHRSIAWIRITAGGQVLKPQGTGTDIMDDAVAVHEHEFLWATEESTAADIAEAINQYFPEKLSAESSGDVVDVRAVSGEVKGDLGIEIYTY